jgi:hypothetical protein
MQRKLFIKLCLVQYFHFFFEGERFGKFGPAHLAHSQTLGHYFLALALEHHVTRLGIIYLFELFVERFLAPFIFVLILNECLFEDQ